MKHLLAAFIILLSLLAVVSGALADSRVAKPNIIPKEQWGSMKEGEFYNNYPFDPYSQGPIGDPRAITIHHTASPEGTHPPNQEEDKKKLLIIQHMHVGKGWGDVGYHFLIGSDGTIYQGRPLPWMGTHAPPNSYNIGMNVIGDFHTKEYASSVQLDSVIRLGSWLCDTYDINPLSTIEIYGKNNFGIVGHRDWGATACPGDRFYAMMPAIREQIHATLLAKAPAYDSRIWCNQYLPQALLEGRTYQLPFTVRNTGFVQWSWLNVIGLTSLVPDIIGIESPTLSDKEEIQPLSNRAWQISVKAGKPGMQHLALQMKESDRQFGPELAWDARVIPADGFISQWLTIAPFEAKSPESAYATDYFQGKPIDILDVMDTASETAHAYNVTGEYHSGESNARGEDGERVKENGRYYRGEEAFTMSTKGIRSAEVILRRLIDADTRDQDATVYLDGVRFKKWTYSGMDSYRRWRNLDLVIPSNRVFHKDSVGIRVKSDGTVQWGNTSFRYTLLDSAEPLVAPASGDKVGKAAWKPWKATTGICELDTMYTKSETGAAYMVVYVKSPLTKYVELRTGYNGWIKAWLNGEQAITGKADVQDYPDTLKNEVLLKRGWNRLLVKVALEPGMKDLYVRLCEKDGQPIKGLIYSLEPMNASTGNQELVAMNR